MVCSLSVPGVLWWVCDITHYPRPGRYANDVPFTGDVDDVDDVAGGGGGGGGRARPTRPGDRGVGGEGKSSAWAATNSFPYAVSTTFSATKGSPPRRWSMTKGRPARRHNCSKALICGDARRGGFAQRRRCGSRGVGVSTDTTVAPKQGPITRLVPPTIQTKATE